MKGTASASAAATMLSVCLVLAGAMVSPSPSWACTYVDPQVSSDGYREWCACIGGTYSERPFRCDPSASQGGPQSQGGGRQAPSRDWQAEQQQERLRREEEQRRAEEEARQREEARRRQFEQDKQDALKLLKSDSGKLGVRGGSGSGGQLKGAASTATGLKEPTYSKGTKYSAPVDLKSVSPEKPAVVSPNTLKTKTDAREKGLKTGYVPKPAHSSLTDYQYERKSRNDIILDAMEVGKGDYMASARHLEQYLSTVNPNVVKVQEALSYIQGMAEGDYIRNKKAKPKDLLAPEPDDSAALLEAVSGETKQSWPGPTVNPEQVVPLANPLDWRSVRDSAIAEAFAALPKDGDRLNKANIERCIQLLNRKEAKNPDVNGYSQALEFFKGLKTHY